MTASHHAYDIVLDHDAFHKPELDKCLYRRVRLPNGLDVLVVSDPKADKAAAALSVHVGHFSDPDELPGLAHFLEHLLFMGTEAFPEENAYSEFLAKHGGTFNAYTAANNTVYFFDVHPDHLSGALDRFSQFFVTPLFSESCVEREVNAIMSEHEKNVRDDQWRIMQLRSHLADARHPYAKFGTGTADTLLHGPRAKGIDSRARLIDFYREHYSANLMRLVLVGKDDLDTLSAWAADRFSDIVNRHAPVPEDAIPGHPWELKSMARKVVRLRTVCDLKSINIRWAFPQFVREWRALPANYLVHLLGHEGHGSLLSELKLRGLVSSLSAGTEDTYSQFDFFNLTMGLTDRGIECADEIVEAVFQYLARLRELAASPDGLPRWVYDEQRVMAELTFRFAEPDRAASRASDYAARMQFDFMDPEWLIAGDSIPHDWRPDLIRRGLEALNSDVEITLAAKSFPDGTPELDQREPIYGSEFRVDDMDASLLERIERAAPSPALVLPEPNPFIPSNLEALELHESGAPTVAARVVRSSRHARSWVQPDSEFGVPRASLLAKFRSPLPASSARAAALTEFLVDVANDALTEVVYEASLAGLTGWLTASPVYGMYLYVSGYTPKLAALAGRVIGAWADVATVGVSDEVFDRLRRDRVRAYDNVDQQSPLSHVFNDYVFSIEPATYRAADKKRELEACTPADLRVFASELRERMFVETFLYGTVDDAEYLACVDTVVLRLGAGVASSTANAPCEWWAPLAGAELEGRHLVSLPVGNNVATRTVPDAAEANNAVNVAIQVGLHPDVRTHALVSLLADVTEEPAFNVLRTKRQLGYIVMTGCLSMAKALSYYVAVQSTYPAAYVEACIEEFLAVDVARVLAELSETEFARRVEVLAASMLERSTSLAAKAARVWNGAIDNEWYEFDWEEQLVAALRKLALADLVDFFQTRVAPSASERRRVSYRAVSQVATPEEEATKADISLLDPAHVPAAPPAAIEGDLRQWSLALEPIPPLVLQL
ncbi:metalloprotease [Blastocladiella emersonii ATCC 22665]|nr:metalloprotease [Blastocladiella emersonii ATCC 22665]